MIGRQLRVLATSPHTASQGGVASFISLMRRRLRPSTIVERLVIGQRPREVGVPLVRLLCDYFRFTLRVASNRYDVIQLNPSLTVKSTLRDAMFLAILRLLGRRNVLVFVHGWRQPLERRIAASRFRRRLFRWLFRDVGRVLVLSKKFRAGLAALGVAEDRIEVVTTAFDGKPLGRALAEREGTGRSILFLSRLVREKGIYELLEAFAGLVSRYPDLELVLAGDGPELMAVTRRVAELGLEGRVSFPGYVRGPRKYRLLTGARVFVLPSYTEGLPVSLLEAMGAGAAVVASDTGGIGEVVSVPRNGLLLDQITPDSIAAALDRLLADDAYASQVSEANREQAWRLYEGEVVARVLERNYRAIVEART